MSSTIFKLITGTVVAFILIAIVGAVLNSNKTGVKDQAVSLKLSIDSTLSIISEYQSSVKSSNLRSSSTSLYSVLSNTNRDLTSFMTENYKYNAKEDDKKFADDVALEKDGLESALFEAKINGILDQVYANKMAYVIALISAKETSLYNATSDSGLQNLLATSYNSLENLYNQFNDFQK